MCSQSLPNSQTLLEGTYSDIISLLDLTRGLSTAVHKIANPLTCSKKLATLSATAIDPVVIGLTAN